MKKITSILSCCLFALFALTGCLEKLPDDHSLTLVEGSTVKVGVNAQVWGVADVSASTKGNRYSYDENATENICIGVYDKETDALVGAKYDIDIRSKQLFDLVVGKTYIFVAFANHWIPYNSNEQPGLPSTYTALCNPGSALPYMDKGLMCGSVEHTVNGLYSDTNDISSNYSNVTIMMRRCYAKLRIKVSGLTGSGLKLKSIRIGNPNPDIYPFRPEPSYHSSNSTLPVYDAWSADRDEAPADRYYVLYCPENMMGTPSSLESNTNPANKNPEIIEGYENKCTYVEFVMEGSSPLEGTITYRFYPGANNTNNFDIERNTVYNINVSLSKNNIYNSTWRVDPQWNYNVGNITTTNTNEDYILGKKYTVSITIDNTTCYTWLKNCGLRVDFIDNATGTTQASTTLSVPQISQDALAKRTKISFSLITNDVFESGYFQLSDLRGKVIWRSTASSSCVLPEFFIVSSATFAGGKISPTTRETQIVSTINDEHDYYFLAVPNDVNKTIINNWLTTNHYEVVVSKPISPLPNLDILYNNSTSSYSCIETPLTLFDERDQEYETDCIIGILPIRTLNDGTNDTYSEAMTRLYNYSYNAGSTSRSVGTLSLYSPTSKTISLVPVKISAYKMGVRLAGLIWLGEADRTSADHYFAYIIYNPSNIVLDVITALSSNENYSSDFLSYDKKQFTTNSSYRPYYDKNIETKYRYRTKLYDDVQPLRAYSYKRVLYPTNSDEGSLTIRDEVAAEMEYYGQKAYLAYPKQGFISHFFYGSLSWMIDCQIRIHDTSVAMPIAQTILDIDYQNQDAFDGYIMNYYAQLWNGNTLLIQTSGTPSRTYHSGLNAQRIYDLVHEIKTSTFTASVNSDNRLVATYNGTNGQLTSASFSIPLQCNYRQGGFNYTDTWRISLENNYLFDETAWTNLYRNYWMCAWDVSETPTSNDVYSQYSEPYGHISITDCAFSYKTGKQLMWIPEFTNDETGWTVPYLMYRKTKPGSFRNSTTNNPDGSSHGIYINANYYDDEVDRTSLYTPDPIKVVTSQSYEKFPAVTSEDRYIYLPKNAEYN